MKSDLFDEKKVVEEVQKHREFLNFSFGFAMFSLGVGCLGTPNSKLTATFVLPVLISLMFASARHASPTLIALRELAKESNDQHVKDVLAYLEKKYLGFKSLFFSGFMFWYGLAFYLAIFGSNDFVEWIKKI